LPVSFPVQIIYRIVSYRTRVISIRWHQYLVRCYCLSGAGSVVPVNSVHRGTAFTGQTYYRFDV